MSNKHSKANDNSLAVWHSCWAQLPPHKHHFSLSLFFLLWCLLWYLPLIWIRPSADVGEKTPPTTTATENHNTHAQQQQKNIHMRFLQTTNITHIYINHPSMPSMASMPIDVLYVRFLRWMCNICVPFSSGIFVSSDMFFMFCCCSDVCLCLPPALPYHFAAWSSQKQLNFVCACANCVVHGRQNNFLSKIIITIPHRNGRACAHRAMNAPPLFSTPTIRTHRQPVFVFVRIMQEESPPSR